MCREQEARVKYCSKQCVKRAYVLRKNPNINSYFKTDNRKFWLTETGIGFKWEKYAAKKLGATHLEFNCAGADLDWNGKPVDVKSCTLYRPKEHKGRKTPNHSGWWVFNRNSFKPEVEFFFCICLDENGKVVKELLIPASEFKGKGITVGHKSRYDSFIFGFLQNQ